MDCQVVQGDFIRPQGSLDLDPLHQPPTEINCGEVESLAAHTDRSLASGGVHWVVDHSGALTDFSKE